MQAFYIENFQSNVKIFLQNIIGMLDSTRIEWEDLKNTENSFSEKIISEILPERNASIDVSNLVELPVMKTMTFSPFVEQSEKSLR